MTMEEIEELNRKAGLDAMLKRSGRAKNWVIGKSLEFADGSLAEWHVGYWAPSSIHLSLEDGNHLLAEFHFTLAEAQKIVDHMQYWLRKSKENTRLSGMIELVEQEPGEDLLC